MHTPILVIDIETSDILYFETIQQAQSYIEPEDVEVYRVYSADGQAMHILIDKARPSVWEPDRVRLEPSNELDTEALRKALFKYLCCPKLYPELSDDQTLPALVELLRKIQQPGS